MILTAPPWDNGKRPPRVSSYHVAEHHPVRPESLLPYTEQSSRPLSELSSVDPNVYVLVYALLVGHARKEKEV